MTTLITGATGFLGEALTREVVRRGDAARVLVRPTSDRASLDALGVECIAGDVNDRASVARAVRGCDRVFHAAGLVATWRRDPSDYDRANVVGTRNVIESALDAGVRRMVYTSTFLALKPSAQPMKEDSRASAEETPTDYARTKRLALEWVDGVVAKGAPVVVVFPGTIFGPGRLTAGNLLVDWIIRFLRGRFPGFLGRGEQVWNFAFVEDVVRGHLLAAEKGAPGRGYCLGGENAAVRKFMGAVASAAGVEPPTRCAPFALAKVIGLMQECRATLTGKPPELTRAVVDTFRRDWPLDSSNAQAELGYAITPLDEAVRRTLEWIRAEGLAE